MIPGMASRGEKTLIRPWEPDEPEYVRAECRVIPVTDEMRRRDAEARAASQVVLSNPVAAAWRAKAAPKTLLPDGSVRPAPVRALVLQEQAERAAVRTRPHRELVHRVKAKVVVAKPAKVVVRLEKRKEVVTMAKICKCGCGEALSEKAIAKGWEYQRGHKADGASSVGAANSPGVKAPAAKAAAKVKAGTAGTIEILEARKQVSEANIATMEGEIQRLQAELGSERDHLFVLRSTLRSLSPPEPIVEAMPMPMPMPMPEPASA